MKRTLFLALICLPAFAAAISGQSVVIVPKISSYARPKPIMEFKKTFIVRRPIARASNKALSRKITAAISPEAVLGLNIKEELGEYQWLEEANYEVVFNRSGVLCVKLWMAGTAAYPDDVTKHVVVNLSTGNRVRPEDVFTNLSGLASLAKKAQQKEIRTAVAEMKTDPEAKDADPAQLFEAADFTIDNLKEFSVNAKGVTFYYDYGFPHVLKALQPSGEYSFTWAQLKPHIRRDGLLARFIS